MKRGQPQFVLVVAFDLCPCIHHRRVALANGLSEGRLVHYLSRIIPSAHYLKYLPTVHTLNVSHFRFLGPSPSTYGARHPRQLIVRVAGFLAPEAGCLSSIRSWYFVLFSVFLVQHGWLVIPPKTGREVPTGKYLKPKKVQTEGLHIGQVFCISGFVAGKLQKVDSTKAVGDSATRRPGVQCGQVISTRRCCPASRMGLLLASPATRHGNSSLSVFALLSPLSPRPPPRFFVLPARPSERTGKNAQ